MSPAPLSIARTTAGHYHTDALDFASRFDLLRKDQLHKTGRIKSFVDLVMGCESALKAHIFLSSEHEDPVATYRTVRSASHDISKLADLAHLMQDRTAYETIKEQLGRFSVLIRYSLDAYATFFPSLVNFSEAPIVYDETVGNDRWVLSIRDQLSALLDTLKPELSGIIDNDIVEILQHEADMDEFMRKVAPAVFRTSRPPSR